MLFRKRTPSDEKVRNDVLRAEYESTDFGRRYGWWLCLRGKRIADLNYLCWDWNSQFWHAYRVFPFDSAFAEIGFDADLWCQSDVTLESRYAEGIRETGILMSPRADNVVMVRSVCVPESEFARVFSQFDQVLKKPVVTTNPG